MARYIDADALTAEFKRLTLGENSLIERIFADGVYAVIDTFPDADVVPKSVVERLQIEVEALKIANGKMYSANKAQEAEVERLQEEADRNKRYFYRHDYDEMIAEAKAEVAREIFAEIEEAMKRWEVVYSSDHFGYGGGAYGYLEIDVDHTIYELKKKYTEEKT